MITQNQLAALGKFYQIDTVTVMREYLQLVFLSWLYREKKADGIFFKGGTSLRLLFDSPRFSEDLDFSSLYPGRVIKLIVGPLEKSIGLELPGVKIVHLHTGLNTSRFRLIFMSPLFKYPMVIRLDFNRVKKTEKIIASPVTTRYPVALMPVVNHLSAGEILAEKICALIGRTKGRDIFDVWFLMEKGISVDKRLINQKLSEQKTGFKITDLSKKINNFPQKELALDLNQFLPETKRKMIGSLRVRLLDQLTLLF